MNAREMVEVARPVRVDSAVSAAGGSADEQRRRRARPSSLRASSRSISSGMSSRRLRSGGSIDARRPTAAPAAPASNLPSAARLPSGSLLVHTSVTLSLSSFGSRNARPFCSIFEYWPISAQYSTPSRASSSSASGLAVRRAPLASATHGASAVCSARAAMSWPVPGSPRIRIGRRAAISVLERALGRRGSRALAPSAASETRRGSCAAALFSARAIVDRSFCEADRLLEEVERADLRRVDGGLDRAVAGHHHDRHRELAAAPPIRAAA